MCKVLLVLFSIYLIAKHVDAAVVYKEYWLKGVPLDHFNLFDNRTWDMRYYVNDKYFKPGQPLFIEVGGEWTIDGRQIKEGQIFTLAKKYQGLLVETEHRYYGKSLPFQKVELKEMFNYDFDTFKKIN